MEDQERIDKFFNWYNKKTGQAMINNLEAWEKQRRLNKSNRLNLERKMPDRDLANKKFKIIEEDFIVNHKKKIDTKRTFLCVYFLIRENKIVYVGKSSIGLERIFSHIPSKEFDSYYFIRCQDEQETNELEALYIVKFDPYYNETLPKNNHFVSINKLKSIIKAERAHRNLQDHWMSIGVKLNRLIRHGKLHLYQNKYISFEEFHSLPEDSFYGK